MMTYPEQPGLTPEKALFALTRQRQRGEELLKRPHLEYADYQMWSTTTRPFIVGSLGPDSDAIEQFDITDRHPSVASFSKEELRNPPPPPSTDHWKARIRWKLRVIESCTDQLELFGPSTLPGTGPTGLPKDGKVFLVHGRNEGVRESVARFLEHLDLPVSILHEQPNKSRTIIEKFEDYAAEVGFAVVLLTGDEKGGLVGESSRKYRLRPRPNVLFELGFFLGKLNRDRVCVLYEDGVEIPSDYSGILFIPLDPNRRWHVELAKELKAAGYNVDLERAFK